MKRITRCFLASLFLPLHWVPRWSNDARNYLGTFPEYLCNFGKWSASSFLQAPWNSNLKKPPSTSELIDWLSLLMADDMPEDVLRNRDTSKAIPPLYGALIKTNKMYNCLNVWLSCRDVKGGNNPCLCGYFTPYETMVFQSRLVNWLI